MTAGEPTGGRAVSGRAVSGRPSARAAVASSPAPAEALAARGAELSATASAVLAALMAVQSALGLALPGLYRDDDPIRATWFGNDWVTLVVGVPLLAAALRLARRSSTRGLLLALGMVAYAVYNYAFYLLGTALNPVFPLYAALVVLSALALGGALGRTNAAAVAARFRPAAPVRLVGGYLVAVAAGLAGAWTGMWAAHVFAGRPLPLPADAFRLVAALDLVLIVPALTVGGVLLWRRQPWGYVIATTAAIQGSLYLLVLTVNSAIAVARGLAPASGELPLWGTLAVGTAAAAALLLANVDDAWNG